MAETGVEKARVMHAEFAHHGDIGRHFGGAVGRDGHRLPADEDVEGTGIEDDVARAVGTFGADLFPEIGDVMGPDPVRSMTPVCGLAR
jgi:hypothetical protein